MVEALTSTLAPAVYPCFVGSQCSLPVLNLAFASGHMSFETIGLLNE